MTEEEKKLVAENTAAMRDMQSDFQTFYKIVKAILPEIEHTKTLTRLEKEKDDFMKSCKIKFQ